MIGINDDGSEFVEFENGGTHFIDPEIDEEWCIKNV